MLDIFLIMFWDMIGCDFFSWMFNILFDLYYDNLFCKLSYIYIYNQKCSINSKEWEHIFFFKGNFKLCKFIFLFWKKTTLPIYMGISGSYIICAIYFSLDWVFISFVDLNTLSKQHLTYFQYIILTSGLLIMNFIFVLHNSFS